MSMSSAMRTRCAFNAAAALRRVFLTTSLSAPSSISRHALPSLTSRAPPSSARTLYIAATPAPTKPSPKTLPKDSEILDCYPVVHIVSDNGRLSPPTYTDSILHNIDPKTHSLITVALPSRQLRSKWDSANSGKGEEVEAVEYNALSSHSIKKSKDFPAMEKKGYSETELENEEAAGAYDPRREMADSPTKPIPSLPICKIVPLSHFLPAKYKSTAVEGGGLKKKEKKSNPALTLKTLELNWAIDAHDLEHRLNTMKGFLRKGYRVDILLIGKRKKRKAEPEEAQATLRRVKEAVGEVEGAKEWKAMDGKVGGMMKLFVEGKEEVGSGEGEGKGKEGPLAGDDVPRTKTGKKLSKNRLRQMGLLTEEMDSIDKAAREMGPLQ